LVIERTTWTSRKNVGRAINAIITITNLFRALRRPRSSPTKVRSVAKGLLRWAVVFFRPFTVMASAIALKCYCGFACETEEELKSHITKVHGARDGDWKIWVSGPLR